MKKPVKETLRLAVERLFVRIHGDLFHEIEYYKSTNFKITRIRFDPNNGAHVELVELCKEKIGYHPIAMDQDIFYSILQVYEDAKLYETQKLAKIQNENAKKSNLPFRTNYL